MKEFLTHKMFKKNILIIFISLFFAIISNAQWTFTYNVTYSCSSGYIPYPPFPNVVMYTKEACEYNRSGVLSSSGNDVGILETCIQTITATPCVNSGGGGSTGEIGDYINPNKATGQVNPGDVSLYGIYEGKPFSSTHQSSVLNDMAAEYQELLKRLGVSIGDGQAVNSPVALTGDPTYDAFLINQYLQFNPNFNNNTNKPLVVNPSDVKTNSGDNTAGTINPNDLKASEPAKPSLKDSYVPPLVPSEIKEQTKHENIELARESLVSLAGIAPKPFSYLGIAIVDIYAANATQLMDCLDGNCQPTLNVYINMASQVATDVAVQGVGDLGSMATGKLFANLASKNGNMLKGADMGFKEFRKGIAEEVVPQIGEGHFAVVSGVTDLAKKWVNASGVETIYD